MKCLLLACLCFFLSACSGQNESESTASNAAIVTTPKPDLTRRAEEVFSFTLLPPTGNINQTRQGDSADLLLSIPYFFSSGLIPPDFVVNEILATGISDAGMSGGVKWKPYALAVDQFPVLHSLLKKKAAPRDLHYRQPPEWVSNFQDWHVWVFYIRNGVPWKQHKKLNDIVYNLELQIEAARKNHDEKRVQELNLELIKAGENLVEFTMQYIKKR